MADSYIPPTLLPDPVFADTTQVDTPQNEWYKLSRSMSYLFGTGAEKAAIEDTFTKKYDQGLGIINQSEGPKRSSWENAWNITKDSFRDIATATRISDDVAEGKFDGNTAKLLADYSKRHAESYTPEPMKKVEKEFQHMTKEYDDAEGLGEKLSAAGSNIYDTLKILIDNPEGVLQLFAQSSGTMAPIMAGSVAGAKIATAVVPTPVSTAVGAAVGSIGGMIGQFSGEMASEMGYRMIQEAQTELAARNLPPTEENFQELFKDGAWGKTAFKKSRLKAFGTAASDVAFSAFAGKVGSKLKASARVAGRRITAVGAHESVLAANIAEEYAKITAGQKLIQHLKAAGTEMISEPATELIGSKLAGDKTSTGELAGEFLGGIGGSVVMTSIDKAVHGTKLSAAAIAAGSKIATDTLQNARIKHDYGKKVSEALKTGETAKYSDIEGEDFDPVVAVDIIRKQMNQKGTTKTEHAQYLKDAVQLKKASTAKINSMIDQANVLQGKVDENKATTAEVAEAETLNVKIDDLVKAMGIVDKVLISMTPKGKTDLKIQSTAQIAVEQEDSELLSRGIDQIIGSKSFGSDINEFLNLSEIVANENLSDAVRSKAKNIQTLHEQKVELRKGKTTADVRADVFKGVDGFKGIEFYLSKISNALQSGDEKAADTFMGKLVNFKNIHSQKVDTFSQKVQELKDGSPMSKEAIAHLEELHGKRKANAADGKGYTIDTGKFVNGVLKPASQEVAALNTGVAIAEQMFNDAEQEIKVDLTPYKSTALPVKKKTVKPVPVKPTVEEANVEEGDASNISNNTEIFDEVDNGKPYQGKFTKRYDRLPTATTIEQVRDQINMLEQDIEVNQDALNNTKETDTEQRKEGNRILAKQKRKKRLLIKQEATLNSANKDADTNVEKSEDKPKVQKEKEASSESETSTAKAKEITPTDLTVTVPVEKNSTETKEVNATQELQTVEEELSVYKRLLDCIKN